MKSFNEADRTEREINRLVFFGKPAGDRRRLAAHVCCWHAWSRVRWSCWPPAYRPSEKVIPKHLLPSGGTQEVRYLSRVFSRDAAMKFRRRNRALVESERLATIGRMASFGYPHDLRHYLAAVYANAEFLASLCSRERTRGAFR